MTPFRAIASLAAALGAAVSFGGGPRPHAAEPPALSIVCQIVDYGRLAAHLARRFGERPVAIGAATDASAASGAGGGGVATVVFASAAGATWTLVHLWPVGTACIAASGEHWDATGAAPAGAGEES